MKIIIRLFIFGIVGGFAGLLWKLGDEPFVIGLIMFVLLNLLYFAEKQHNH